MAESRSKYGALENTQSCGFPIQTLLKLHVDSNGVPDPNGNSGKDDGIQMAHAI